MKPSRGAPQVLVVDDDRALRDTIHDALRAEGYGVLSAPHGAAALELLRRFTPDVIVLDLRMPIMDGWAFLRSYAERSGSRAAVIVLTAVHGTTAMPPGADAMIAKPFAIADLLALVKQQLEARFAPNS